MLPLHLDKHIVGLLDLENQLYVMKLASFTRFRLKKGEINSFDSDHERFFSVLCLSLKWHNGALTYYFEGL